MKANGFQLLAFVTKSSISSRAQDPATVEDMLLKVTEKMQQIHSSIAVNYYALLLCNPHQNQNWRRYQTFLLLYYIYNIFVTFMLKEYAILLFHWVKLSLIIMISEFDKPCENVLIFITPFQLNSAFLV